MTARELRMIEVLLDRPIAYHLCLAQAFDSVAAAIMLGQAIYWCKRTSDPERWFYKSARDWTAETYLSRHEQVAARKAIGDILETKRAGIPATCHYRVNYEKLLTRLTKNGVLEENGSYNQTIENPPTTPLKTETTAETTTKRPSGGFLFAVSSDDLPPPLNREDVRNAWDNWQLHCRQKGKPLTERAATMQIRRLQEWGPERTIAAIERSILNRWTGIFEDDKKRNGAVPRLDSAALQKNPEAAV